MTDVAIETVRRFKGSAADRILTVQTERPFSLREKDTDCGDAGGRATNGAVAEEEGK